MFDNIVVSAMPVNAEAYAGYVDGHWPTFKELQTKFPHAHLLSIAVFAKDNADCLDVETGDATPAEAMVWVMRQFERGVARPVLYADASTMRVIISLMAAGNIPRSTLRLWSAHYTQHPHFCGPHTCGEVPLDVDGTQWTSHAMGRSLDQSVMDDNFFGTPVVVKPQYISDSEEKSIMAKLPYIYPHSTDAVGVWFRHRIQSILTDVFGYVLVKDGNYSAKSIAGIEWLQNQYGLHIDGIVGPETWSVLYAGSK